MVLLRTDKRGQAGFFEDIPVLIVITVAVGIFLLSASHVYISYNQAQKYRGMYNECNSILRAVRSYDKILALGTYPPNNPVVGMYEYSRLDAMDTNQMITDIHSQYKYRVNITDEETGRSWEYGAVRPAGEITVYSLTTGVCIKQKENVINVGHLQVSMWA